MKRVLIATLFLLPVIAWAEKPNPADYTVNVHVQSSRIELNCGDVTNGSNICGLQQHLSVLIDGKKFELAGPTTSKKVHLLPGPSQVLRVGDYEAKAVNAVNDHAYEYSLNYEFLFPDGETRKYLVIGESQ
jgi:hypothetical protein